MKHALPMPARVRGLVRELADDHGLKVADVLFGSQHPHIRARWEIWTVLRDERPQPSLPLIGGWFDVDHTTVLYGLRQAHAASRMSDQTEVRSDRP